ncbi:glycosyltransferase family 2 protein [Candidatus Deianiraea vastatrix]|uniref:Cell coat glycosyltransferase family 2 n=1 Tax=Candidatus Deianiraea vastatrix TaxID=2163644 RepID=A0A5B8XF40_9RICK|nr:glycosyltransferase [Candidatus Deianiraea vastatrix]QED23893.1 Putative cell coat glycosyltransferase family 2 [Candidatus Deianiraea vastatrix]
MKNPKITVFISYYNDEQFIAESISSILKQTFDDFELILLDHASLDKSAQIAHSFKDERIVHLKMEKNILAGGSELFLKILDAARGEYIKFFCADDVMEENCLEELMREINQNPNIDMLFSDMSVIDEQGKMKKNNYVFNIAFGKSENELLKFLFNGITLISYPTVLIKKSKIYREYVCRIGIQLFDVKLWANLLLGGCTAKFVNQKLVRYRIHKNQMSGLHVGSKISNRLAFEEFHLLDLFLEKMNFETAKKVFGNEISDNKEFLKFNLCKIALDSDNFQIRLSALHNLFNLLQDDDLRRKIDLEYGFGIKEMRYLMTLEKFSIHHRVNAKHNIFMLVKKYGYYFCVKLHIRRPVKQIYLIIKRIFNIV